jgi:hypothetical protein
VRRPQLVANKEKEKHAEDDGYDFQGPIFALQHPVSFPVRIALIRHADSPLLVALEGEPRTSEPVPLQMAASVHSLRRVRAREELHHR